MVELRERMLSLNVAERSLPVLLADERVGVPRLVDVARHVRRERRRHLAVLCEAQRELRLLERLDDALRLRHELGLAQPASRLGRLDEPLRVLCAQVAVDPLCDRLRAELRDRVTRVDALRAALVAEEAARAVPAPVLGVVLLEPLDHRAVAWVTVEAHPLRPGLRAEGLRTGVHRRTRRS